MRRIDRLLNEYGACHQNELNKRIHWICVTTIFFSVVGLLWSIPFPFASPPYVNWATVTAVPVILYYLALSVPLAVGMAILMVLFFLRGARADVGPRHPLAGLRRDLRGLLGVPVHRPQGRRQEAVLSQRRGVPADRPRVSRSCCTRIRTAC